MSRRRRMFHCKLLVTACFKMILLSLSIILFLSQSRRLPTLFRRNKEAHTSRADYQRHLLFSKSLLTKNDNLLPYYFGDASGKVIKEKEKRLTSFIPNNNWTTASQKTVFQLRDKASHIFFPCNITLKKALKEVLMVTL